MRAKTPTIDHVVHFTVVVIAGLSLLAPMIALSYVNGWAFVLLTTCFVVLLFAFVLSMVVQASLHEVMVATATYATVLVVFVGQSNTPMK